MAYRTPEERISDLVGRGWRGLANRFERLRGGTAQAQPTPVEQQATTQPAASPFALPQEPSGTQMAKVPAGKISAQYGLSAPPVTAVFAPTGGMRPQVPAGMSAGASYDTGKAFTLSGDQLNFAGPGGMRSSMSLKDFHDQMNPAETAGSRNPTWDDYFAQQAARRDTPRGRFFGATPLPGTGSSSQGSIGEEVMRGAGLRRAKTIADTALQARGQDNEMEQAGLRNQIAAEQNRLLAERNEATLPGERLQGEAAQLELDTARKAQGLLDQFNAETDDVKKAAILQQYKMLTGMKEAQARAYPVTEEEMTPQGIRSTSSMIVEDPSAPGGFRKVVPQVTGQGDLQALAGRLKPEQRSKAAEYIKARPEEDKAEVLRRIIAGEL